MLAPRELTIWPCAMNLWLCNHCRLTQPSEVQQRPGRNGSPNVIHVHRAADGIDIASAVMDTDSARRGTPCRILLGRNSFSSPREVRLAILGSFRISRYWEGFTSRRRCWRHPSTSRTAKSFTTAFPDSVMLSQQSHRPLVGRYLSISCPRPCTMVRVPGCWIHVGGNPDIDFASQIMARIIDGKDTADNLVPEDSTNFQLAVFPLPPWQSTA